MAEFTAFNLPKPQGVNYPTGAVMDSTTAMVGTVLGGVATIGDAVLGRMEKNNSERIANETSSKLTSLVQENFGAQSQVPQLVGEKPADSAVAAAQSSPVVKGTLAQLNRLDQANQQGSLSPQELFTRGSVIVQDAINQNPMFAQEIRQAAQNVLGVQPTQELVKLAEEDSQQAKALAASVKHSNVMAAANAGITYVKPDGSLDFDQMSSAGQQLQFSEKQMADALKQAQLNTAALGPKPSHDEMISSETSPFIKTANPVFDKVMDGMMASVPATIAKLSGQGKPQQIAGVLQAVGTQQAQMNNWINKMIIQNNISPDAAAQLRTYYNAPFESLKGLAQGGDFSYFATNAATLKAMNDTGQMTFLQSAPTVAKVHFAGGDQAVASFFNVFAGTNTKLREGMNKDLNGYFTGATPETVLSNGANALAGGGYQLHMEQNPDVQSKTLKGLVGTMNSYTLKPDALTDTEKKAFGNATVQITNLGLQSNDPKNLATAANVVNSPATLATFDSYAKDPKNANQVPIVAQGMIALNTKSIVRNVPLLMQGMTVQVPSNDQAGLAMDFAAGGNPSTNETAQVTPHFNPVNGKIEFAIKLKGRPLSSTQAQAAASQVGDYARQVAGVNRSLDAIVHLAPNGVGREKDFKPLEIRQLITGGAGLPVKEGTKPVPMPNFTKQAEQSHALPKEIADAQIEQESGGQNGIVSPQGAVGIAQILPRAFPQYNAEKLKNDPAYALKARDEIMADLLKKHKGNVALALAEYHGGPNQSQWGPKTFGYVSSIMQKANK